MAHGVSRYLPFYILDKKDLQKDILIYILNYAPIFY